MTNFQEIRKRLRAGAVGALVFAATASPAAAQGWVNPDDFYRMSQELERLSAEIEILRGAGPLTLGEEGGAAPSGDLILRFQRLEQTVRDLTGRVETLEFAARQGAQNERLKLEELEFRVSRLEGGEPGARRGPTTPSVGAPSGASTLGVETPPSGRLKPLTPLNTRPGGGVLGQIESEVPQGPVSEPILDNPNRPPAQAAAPSAGAGTVGGFGAAVAAPPRVSYEDALKSIQAGDHGAAEQQLRAFIDQNPTDPRVGVATYWLAETYRVRGRFREAAQTYAAGLSKHPNSKRAPDSWMRLGMSLAQLNQGGKACEAFAQVEARFPDAPSRVLRETKTQARRAGCG